MYHVTYSDTLTDFFTPFLLVFTNVSASFDLFKEVNYLVPICIQFAFSICS